MATKTTFPKMTEPLSPYRLAGFLNDNVEDLDIAPQRMYQYIKSGKLVVELNSLGHKVVTVENGNAFIAWFLDPERGKKATEQEEAAAS